jgi:hypothetical protein
MYGSQTGCINLLEYVPEEKQSNFLITELKLYARSVTDELGPSDVIFNYLFLGSEPNEEITDDWGEPAIPNMPIHYFPAVGGEIIIKAINYYVVGGYEDWVRLNCVNLAYPYN